MTLELKERWLPLCQKHFYHDGTMYLEHLCLPKQSTGVAAKPPHSGSAVWKSQLRPPLDDALLYTFFCTECAHTHPEETCFHHCDFYTLSSFLNDFLHAMGLAFSEEPSPVFSSKTRCNGGEEARQNCQRLSPDFPMTTLHPSLAPLSACFSLSPLGAHWRQVWSHWDVEMCV